MTVWQFRAHKESKGKRDHKFHYLGAYMCRPRGIGEHSTRVRSRFEELASQMRCIYQFAVKRNTGLSAALVSEPRNVKVA